MKIIKKKTPFLNLFLPLTNLENRGRYSRQHVKFKDVSHVYSQPKSEIE